MKSAVSRISRREIVNLCAEKFRALPTPDDVREAYAELRRAAGRDPWVPGLSDVRVDKVVSELKNLRKDRGQ